MIVPYRQLPGSSVSRPFLDVLIGPAGFRVSGLVDSGAVHGLFHPDVATECEVDLAGAERRSLQLGPAMAPVLVPFAVVQMECGGQTWDAEIGFTSAMTLDWGLLGHTALFRWFTISFRWYDDEFDVVPIAD